MLTNHDIERMAGQMSVPLEFCGFKDDLPKKLKSNVYYCINLDDELDSQGLQNKGSHWTGFIPQKLGNGSVHTVYFDSFGQPPPKVVMQRVKSNFGKVPEYTTRDVQSLMADACGWYQLAWAHYCLASPYASKDIEQDTMKFLSFFNDLNHSCDFKQNEYILKHFFVAKDPSMRTEIDVMPGAEKITDFEMGEVNKKCLANAKK